LDIKFFGELVHPSEFKEDFLEEWLDAGYAVEQKLDGETYIKMTSAYYKELGEYIQLHPKELCRDYWHRLVDDTAGYSVKDFLKMLCRTHVTIKQLTNGTVDFCEVIMEEL